jgi:hypothetical protein
MFDHGLQVCIRRRSITACNSISKLCWSQPTCPRNHGLQLHITKPAWSRPTGTSSMWLDYSPESFLQTHSITASMCISTPAQSLPPIVHTRGLELHIAKYWISLQPSPAPTLRNSVLEVDLETSPIITSEYIAGFNETPCPEMVELDAT